MNEKHLFTIISVENSCRGCSDVAQSEGLRQAINSLTYM